MISAKVRYRNLGLSDEQVDVAIACEELAVRLLESGLPPQCVDEYLLDYVKGNARKLGSNKNLIHAHAGMFDEVNEK